MTHRAAFPSAPFTPGSAAPLCSSLSTPPPIQAYNYGITPISEERTLQEMGFDYTYDKGVLDRLKASGEEGRRGSGIQGHVR